MLKALFLSMLAWLGQNPGEWIPSGCKDSNLARLEPGEDLVNEHATHADQTKWGDDDNKSNGALADTNDDPPYVIGVPDILFLDATGLPEAMGLPCRECQIIRGEHLVRPDGTISLGACGKVHVAGLTTDQATAVISKHLESYAKNGPINVSVDVGVYNSKTLYVVVGAGYREGVYPMPLTQGARVGTTIDQFRDAIRGPVWLKRESGQIMKLDLDAIAADRSSAANIRLKRGDRVYIGKQPEADGNNSIGVAFSMHAASESSSPPPTGSSCKGAGEPLALTSTDSQIVAQLIEILDHTLDDRVGVLAIQTLGQMGSAAKSSVPAILRFADRRDLLWYENAQRFTAIVEHAIKMIMGDN